jgi:hypothetical protein
MDGAPSGSPPIRKLRPRPVPWLILTGERRVRRTKVVFLEHDVWLADESFVVLCRLVAARARTDTGCLRLQPLSAHRLRAAFDLACGDGTGTKLIETCPGRRYRLALEPGSIGCVASLWRKLSSQRSLWRTLRSLKEMDLKST